MISKHHIKRENGFKKITIGEGKPIVSVITGIHGDEKTSMIIAEHLRKVNLLRGTLKIYLDVNEPACMSNRRYLNKDLNRVFPGIETGIDEEKIASRLLKEISDSSIVIDLHSFNMNSDVFTICNESTIDLAASFTPDAMWLLDLTEEMYNGTMYYYLTKKNIPNLIVELPSLECLTKDHVERLRQCTDNLLKYMNMIEGEFERKVLPIYNRKIYFAPSHGIFVPYKKINETVEKGDLLGIMIQENYEERQIFAHERGVLIQIRHSSLVHPEETIYALGERVDV